MREVEAEYRVLNDQPYGSGDDPFGFSKLVLKLRQLIIDSRDSTPFTIGIEASWGRPGLGYRSTSRSAPGSARDALSSPRWHSRRAHPEG
jgi:hypothetical protein